MSAAAAVLARLSGGFRAMPEAKRLRVAARGGRRAWANRTPAQRAEQLRRMAEGRKAQARRARERAA